MATVRVFFLLPILVTIAECQQEFNAQDITLALMERVNEPLFIPKCEKGILLKVPVSYMPERYQEMSDSLGDTFQDMAKMTYVIKDVTKPDISELMTLPNNDAFSNFMPMHSRLGSKLISLLMSIRGKENFFSVAAFLRDRLNPGLFTYGFSVALMHRPDCQNVKLPPYTEIFPYKFVDGSVFSAARQELRVLRGPRMTSQRRPIDIPLNYTASDLEPEQRLAYFREDLGINLHHWHWHEVYPFEGPRSIVMKDRRGELFYYMHQQVIARYNFERLCNDLPRAIGFANFQAPVEEGYYSKLDTQTSSKNFAGRPNNIFLRSVSRPSDKLNFTIDDLDLWRSRLNEAVKNGKILLRNGKEESILNDNGIDILGDLMEPNEYNRNPEYYGQLHNKMHVAVALVHDPDNRHLESMGVIGDASTAMRDPVFYKIHTTINDFFKDYKATLPTYSVDKLHFPKVRVSGIKVQTINAPENTFYTNWQKRTMDLSRGLDFVERTGPVFAQYMHLTHRDYNLKIAIDNYSGEQKKGLVRVFLAPRFNERGNVMPFEDQRHMFIEIDKFLVDLKRGLNRVTRSSHDSSVTIPFGQSFHDLEGRPPVNDTGRSVFDYCGCGWPQHMLIPKGTAAGFKSVLFVMVSDQETDWIPKPNDNGSDRCAKAASYCGIRDQKYPDRRPMGYPFDRLPRKGVDNLKSFLTPNMGTQNVVITFSNFIASNPAGNRFG